MQKNRYQIYLQEDFSFNLRHSCRYWQEAVLQASSWSNDDKQKVYIFDTLATSNDEDVYWVDTSGQPMATGHRSHPGYEDIRLTPIATLSMLQLTETLNVGNTVTLLRPLDDVNDELCHLSEASEQFDMLSGAYMMDSPLSRQHHPENDVALMVYQQDSLIATAMFSRYIEDHRFPSHLSELCYELSLHTVYVEPEFRGMGIAASLANTIVNIARSDMASLHRTLLTMNIRLKPWFSALALTAGGEAICDILSEAFVEMNDDVIEELMDDGFTISYQDPIISVESLAV
ncbi:GNAT family N-acetyltransferase [Photobacterium sp. SDRW27]|uniref:GNAT family N-acetyltransferase n=1 Tax=Photobacterium obscurum TaxID=2829490 RepID=UPI002244087B|nr:GNAT family N-acetyltransferase [Photobacterium obscurum]MCW8329769.1 GNAT family N-acetyltransferase [Photobacterium obscurum]